MTPTQAQAPTFKSKDPTTFVNETFGEPDTLDPSLDYETAGSEIIQNTYDTLIWYNKDNVHELVPWLATEVPSASNGGISSDGLTYTFKLRQGVKFHNGDPLTASDVAFTFTRGLLMGGTSSPQWLMYEPLLGTAANGIQDVSSLIDTDGSKGLADSRELMVKQDPAVLKQVCEKVKATVEFKASTLKSPTGASLWDTGFRMTITYNTGNTQRQTIAQIFQNDLTAVNDKFVIEVTGLPWPAFLAAQRAKKLPLFISGWQEDIPDPHNWLVPYASAGGTYSSLQSMPKSLTDQFQPIITAGVKETDPAKRTAIYQPLNQLYYDNVPTLLLAIAHGRHYEQRWVKGWYFNPLYGNLWYYALSKD